MSGMTVAAEVDHGAVRVRGLVDRRSVADSLTARVEAIDGAVSIETRVDWSFDDTVDAMSA